MEKSELPCALCGSHEVDVVATTDRDGKPLRNVLCRECGLVWVDPRPTDEQLQQFYAEDYRSNYKGAAEPKKKHCYREMQRANARVERLGQVYQPGDRLLDVGAGAGFFAFVLRASHVNYHGIEPNQGYAGFARERLGLDGVEVGFLNDVQDFGAYDIITINHVFEHLPNPNESLAHMHKLLREGGHLILEVPNSEADYHSPHKVFHVGHLYWYNPETLRALAAKHGFVVEDLKLVSGTKHVNVILRKDATAADVEWRREYAGNYARVRAFFDRRSQLGHYLSPIPYARFVRKMGKYAGEYRYVKHFDDKIALIESLPCQHIGSSAKAGDA